MTATTSPFSRSRASTLQDPEPEAGELQNQLYVLESDESLAQSGKTYGILQQKVDASLRIRQLLLGESGLAQTKDIFRRLNGFQTLVASMSAIANSAGNTKTYDYDNITATQEFVQAALGVLSAALHNHRGNQKYFRQRVEGNGWQAVKVALQVILSRVAEDGHIHSKGLVDRVFGCLLACALNDESMSASFHTLTRQLGVIEKHTEMSETLKSDPLGKNSVGRLHKGAGDPSTSSLALARSFVSQELGPSSVLQFPDALIILFDMWLLLETKASGESLLRDFAAVHLGLPIFLCRIATLSTSNLSTLHDWGLLNRVLNCLIEIPPDHDSFPDLRALASALLTLGVGSMDDAHLLYGHARSSSLFSELLMSSVKSSRSPSFIHFDLSLNGYASIELPTIGKSFPPAGSSAGYTLSLWFQIVHFDPRSHTTIFGTFDASQKCFVLAYLEKDTHNLILQTSVTSSRPSVRFKSASFVENRWYHVVITHRRPKATSSSRASLFIDGEFIEQVKSQYPTAPPLNKTIDEGDETASTNRRGSNAIQAFLGTPQDLATKLGKGVVHTQWRLALATVFADVLSDDLIAVYSELGPRYTGNYQDCLGSFQTYQASAALNLRNESLHPGKEEKSDIVSAIRSKAGNLLPESKILLNVSATVVLDDNDQNSIDETHLLKFLSKNSGRTLRNVTRGGSNALAINGAIPSINEALLHSSGFAVLTGEPTVVAPLALDDASWRVAGCAAVGLALLEASHGFDNIFRALKILFESIHDNWRNSEAMERENGFGVLSTLLSTKLTSLDDTSAIDPLSEPNPVLAILAETLNFLGYRMDNPEDSVINNALAYRILLVDMDYWRSAEPMVQKLYYKQFIIFGLRSKYHHFNSRRLSRMRITKKWLDALKGEMFTAQTFEYFLDAFKSFLTSTLSADAMRSLSLYITYAIYKPRHSALLPSRGKSIKLNTDLPVRRKTLGRTSPNSAIRKDEAAPRLSQLQIALNILEIYTNLLCQKADTTNIKRFAKTVTNKWLLHLLADEEPLVVLHATKILARLLVISGPTYVQKFVNQTGGVIVMQHRLRRWWSIRSIWPICLAILFGADVGALDLTQNFNLYHLLTMFSSDKVFEVVYPAMLPVLTTMLGEGLKVVTRDQSDPDSPVAEKNSGKPLIVINTPTKTHSKRRSMTMGYDDGNGARNNTTDPDDRIAESASTLRTVVRFLADCHSRSPAFRDFAATSPYVQELFQVLFPVVVNANSVTPEMELTSRDSALTFKGNDVIMRPLSANSSKTTSVVRTSRVETSQDIGSSRVQAPRRMSSYILVTSDPPRGILNPELQPLISPGHSKTDLNLSGSLTQEILELTISVFSDQIFSRKDFAGLGLFMRVPAGFQEHQAYFETFILRNTLTQLGNTIKLDQKLLWEPRVLTNMARFATHLGEAIYEGWFIDGATDTLDFLANVLEYLQLPSISAIKSVRLCAHVISNIRLVLLRVVLLRLSELNDTVPASSTVSFLNKLVYWQPVLLPTDVNSATHLRLFCYLVYIRLCSTSREVQMTAADLWRMLVVQKSDEIEEVLGIAASSNDFQLTKGLKKVMEHDNETFLAWMADNRSDLDKALLTSLAQSWEQFVVEENRKTEETAKARIAKRREKLRSWVIEETTTAETLRRHETGTDHWRSNIYGAEHLKRQRALQDQQENQVFNLSTWTKMDQELRRPCGLFEDSAPLKWQLDQTEGKNRMRMRFITDRDAHVHDYQPKRRQSQGPSKHRRSIGSQNRPLTDAVPPLPSQSQNKGPEPIKNGSSLERAGSPVPAEDDLSDGENEEGFEIVEAPRDDSEEYEDKNRRVMRSLQRGDQVENVHNVSRIVGLEAVEGLLILGKSYLYLLDSLFQRSDGEVVNAWQAPPEERDPYLQMITGRKAGDPGLSAKKAIHETRSWRWDDVLSISKRRFLFRDVAIEVFFVDGRSYLLTATNPMLRNELYQKILSKASDTAERGPLALVEDSWRIESVRNPNDEVQGLGSRFTNVFASNSVNPATRKWVKGEISNFHYLMLVNTMAGRTFNDLTQYPVFPWIIADYSSEELDLTNPRSFRDLSKPMGCQNPNRQADFRDRYQSFAEMADERSPPFHYGTHYSSAMIVTSYLIRLQPFVHSYLLLQGDSFDHPDRLFYSIEKAWSSASRDNMTDVRELIPEFFYLPEFLINQNGYDFGTRQGSDAGIDRVELPPWAHGDPKIFIAKHREALESEYVSQHLHQWIDLVFGHKQRGEAALEATNVFHHLSYHGAKNLDTIEDPMERLATIGIIHNFGQTPHQVFQRSHAPREGAKNRIKKLDSAAEGLTRLPFPVVEVGDRASHLQYSLKHERLLCSGPFRLHIGPIYDKYMDWGFYDGSVRFYASETKKPVGLFEHVHQGQLSYVLFADSKTLVTAGSDCTISIWVVVSSGASIDLQPKATFFGHRAAVTTLAVSRSFSALLSAGSDGQVILWDLNRLELVRRLTAGKPVECALINDVTGAIMLCRGSQVSLLTLNGDPILEQNIYVEGDDTISACAFYEGSGNEYLERELIFTGHKKGVVNIWSVAIIDGAFVLEHVKRMHHLDHAGYNIGATITSILPMAQKVYTGDEDGRVYEWDCIQRQ